MLKGDILKEMSGIDIPDEGIPSKAIWNPSGSLSSSSSVASTSSGSSTNDAMEDVDPATYTSSTPAAFEAALPSAEPTENEMRLRIYEDTGSEEGQADDDQTDDDNQMSAMLMSSINTAHGSENISVNATKMDKDEKKNNKLFGSTSDERQKFVNSVANLNDKQLRIQLWDSFRLARVILGKPVKDKRKLSHKSILHAIRKVAEMRIQIIHMSEELERLRHREKRLKRLREKQRSPQPGKENVGEASQKSLPLGIDALSISSSVLSPVSSGDGDEGPGSIRDIISDSDSPDAATAKLRVHAIKILQEESDLALSQIQDIEMRQRKRPRVEIPQEKLLGSPPATPQTPPGLFLSPSESEDDISYGTHESASDMLYAFRGPRSPKRQQQQQQQDFSKIMLSIGEDGPDEADEIRRVLQKVVNFENDKKRQRDEPEITMGSTSSADATQMNHEVIALLTRLTQITPTSKVSPLRSDINVQESPTKEMEETKKPPAKESKTVETQTIPVAVQKEIKKEVAMEVDTTISTEKASAKMPQQERDVQMDIDDDVEKEIDECQALNVISEVEEDLSDVRSQFAAAKMRVAESMEHHQHLSLQRKILEEDIQLARKNTTQNREQVQLERLHRYKKELTKFLKQEEERAKQLESLDAELNDMATHCVKLEDREAEFQQKHEKHVSALKDFKAVSNFHKEKFRNIMGSIDRGIKEQTKTVLGETKTGEDNTKILAAQGSESFDENEEMAEKIQRLEFNLTQKNVEIFKLKAKIMVKERRAGIVKEVVFEKKPEGKPKAVIKEKKPKEAKSKRLSSMFKR
eukprot:CAMPEP_0116145962 /NCGR_PEP_ID=MMETSP0329-20121206/16904_1 /TAXON_ID=697910 /ORGANISM="Pseudo-nitzschia arenysensis, Strain B593" /LENGTH=807 /DNA_ID=CAMNT_0003641665 /DNA_START=52 /DNA_END=2475 /DNA_ORIENTATION=+